MRRREWIVLPRGVLAASLLALAAACSDQPVLAPVEGGAVFAKVPAAGNPAGCLETPDFVVSDEGELRDALASAAAGAAIAIDGVIELADYVFIGTPGLTLGCAARGAGLALAEGATAGMVLWVSAPDVSVSGLFLDGTRAATAAVYTQFVGPDGVPERLRFVGNRVECSPSLCAFFVAAPDLVVTDNVFEGTDSRGGIHVQAGTFRPDRARIERNEIIQHGTSSFTTMLSGIRITTATEPVVADNVIRGAWVRGIGPTFVVGGTFTGNRIEGVQQYGIQGSVGGLTPPGRLEENRIEGNTIAGTGLGGVYLRFACGNVVASNRFEGDGPAVRLDASAGGNIVKQSGLVVDVGYEDCDGDRVADFNTVNGKSTLEANTVAIPVNAPSSCLADPDFVVRTEEELFTAFGSAVPWQSIAVDGEIALEHSLFVDKPAVTFGCASPGSGLSMSPSFEGDAWGFLDVAAPDVTVRGLRVDGTLAYQVPVFAGDYADQRFLNVRFRFVGNDVVYAAQGGVFTANAQTVTITDNRFHGLRAQYGIHVQHQVAGSRVERNEVVVSEAMDPPPSQVAAAIRVRDGTDGRVADNVVRGPWRRGINLAELWDSDVVGNVVEGPQTSGIRTGVNWYEPVSVYRVRIQNNRITGAGQNAMLLQHACMNVLLGNHMVGNGDGVGVVFDVTTGLNVLTGNTVTALDNGDFDCDGDGVADPNVITGKGKVGKGLPPGEIIGTVMSGGRRTPR